ncbi:kinesin-like protein KIF23 isoform X2 [Ornithodoros turicata]|uniref:kinesin-like protein KIF23 isoform X2 n=1 Tax=Ornithodoros turicata TaxID=34597 RepID=UPI003138BD4B
MTTMRPARGKTPKRKPAPKNNAVSKDPVEVYCRLRPLYDQNEVPVIKRLNSKVVQFEPLDTAQSKGPAKQYQYTFKHVFDANASQQEIFQEVALPLVDDLIHGRPGLLFTYGITSSGKTYTMTGSPQDGGILPRSLDVVFNSIGSFQAHKYVFKPDKLNGFDTQTWAEAVLEHQRESLAQASKTPRIKRKDDGVTDWTTRTSDTTKIEDVDPDMAYAVFVSYIEIYNNYVYDLLDDNPIDPIKKQLQSRMLREDSKRCMYAFGVTEVEAKSADEAFDVWCRGQKRKRIAHTTLNAESSRSHSIFNIRLVQSPLDADGSEIMLDKNFVTISQLSLVDLAGSERSVRTGSTGNRIREAGNINNSLMCLRTCIEILRENQVSPDSNKMVPYRDAKLTHLFKNFFEGEGKVKMVVCVNPRADDYDETFHVMKFAEMAQEVLIPRAAPVTPVPVLGLRSCRRRKEPLPRADRFGGSLKDLSSQPLFAPVQEPVLPNYVLTMASDEDMLPRMVDYLNQQVALKQARDKALEQKREDLRKAIVQLEEERNVLKEQQRAVRMDLKAREQQVILLEKKLSNSDSAVQGLTLELEAVQREKRALEQQLREKEMLLNKGAMEKEHMRTEMEDCIALERNKMRRLMDHLLADKQAELESKVCVTQEKFRLLREILNTADWDLLSGGDNNGRDGPTKPTEGRRTRSQSKASPGSSEVTLSTAVSEPKIYASENTKGIPVCNPRHRRSKSSGGELWVDHRPPGNVELGTVMQPVMKKRKSVGKLDVKDVTKRASKYVLTHQEQDASGDIETQLYKGDVIPSIGGGAQVIFNDVETVRQATPISTRLRAFL